MWMFANNLELYTLRNDQAIDNLSSEKVSIPISKNLARLTKIVITQPLFKISSKNSLDGH